MPDLPDVPDIGEGELIEYAKNLETQARDNAPTTVSLSWGGTILGAVAFGPAGGVVGATVGSGIGYLKDEGYFDSDEEPEVIEADIKNEEKNQ
jgi:hypothetical protein